ncbi:MAG: hypothetical protein R3F59_01250 [Myxococcota bacterium]
MSYQPKDADPGVIPTLGALALGLAGICHAALALQFLGMWVLGPVTWLFVVVMLVLGVAATAVAWQLGQARTWAAVAGALLAPVLGIMSTSFTAYALYHASFAFYMLLAPPAAGLAFALVPFAVVPCRRAAKAQAELRQRYTSGPFAGVLDR